MVGGITESHIPGGQPLGRNMQQFLSQHEHSSPTYLILQLRTKSGGFYPNNWETDSAPDRDVTTTEQRGGPTQYLVQALVTTTSVTPIKGIMISIHRGKRWHASMLKTALTPKMLKLGDYKGCSHIKRALQDHNR